MKGSTLQMDKMELRVNRYSIHKKVIITFLMIVLVVTSLSSQAVQEAQNERDRVVVNLGVMKGSKWVWRSWTYTEKWSY